MPTQPDGRYPTEEERDEKVAISSDDPEAVLRALLAVKADDPEPPSNPDVPKSGRPGQKTGPTSNSG